MNWTRQPQEMGHQNYMFSGQFYATRGVYHSLQPEEVLAIYQDVRTFAEQEGGIDYLQVYTNSQGEKLFMIDQISREMIESGKYRNEDNVCTLMFAHEY